METSEKIRALIEENLIVFDESVDFSNSDNLFDLGFVNSLFAMKLLSYIESEFNIKIDNSDIDISNFSSVNSIVSLITKYKN